MPSFMAHKHLKKKKKKKFTQRNYYFTPLYDTWHGVALEVPNIGVEIALPFRILNFVLCLTKIGGSLIIIFYSIFLM